MKNLIGEKKKSHRERENGCGNPKISKIPPFLARLLPHLLRKPAQKIELQTGITRKEKINKAVYVFFYACTSNSLNTSKKTGQSMKL